VIPLLGFENLIKGFVRFTYLMGDAIGKIKIKSYKTIKQTKAVI